MTLTTSQKGMLKMGLTTMTNQMAMTITWTKLIMRPMELKRRFFCNSQKCGTEVKAVKASFSAFTMVATFEDMNLSTNESLHHG